MTPKLNTSQGKASKYGRGLALLLRPNNWDRVEHELNQSR